MANDMLDISESSHELKISEGVRRIMQVMSGWALICSICGFLLSTGGVIISTLGLISVFNRSYFNEEDFFGVILMLAGSIIVFLGAKFLLDYRINLRRSLRQDSDLLLEKAFKGMRNALVLVGIVWILGTAFLLFVLGVLIYIWSVWGI